MKSREGCLTSLSWSVGQQGEARFRKEIGLRVSRWPWFCLLSWMPVQDLKSREVHWLVKKRRGLPEPSGEKLENGPWGLSLTTFSQNWQISLKREGIYRSSSAFQWHLLVPFPFLDFIIIILFSDVPKVQHYGKWQGNRRLNLFYLQQKSLVYFSLYASPSGPSASLLDYMTPSFFFLPSPCYSSFCLSNCTMGSNFYPEIRANCFLQLPSGRKVWWKRNRPTFPAQEQGASFFPGGRESSLSLQELPLSLSCPIQWFFVPRRRLHVCGNWIWKTRDPRCSGPRDRIGLFMAILYFVALNDSPVLLTECLALDRVIGNYFSSILKAQLYYLFSVVFCFILPI